MYSGEVELFEVLWWWQVALLCYISRLVPSCVSTYRRTGAGYILLQFLMWEKITYIAPCSKHVLLAKQRKSKPRAALSEARRSEQRVFLACSEWWSLRGRRVEYSIHTMWAPYAKCLPRCQCERSVNLQNKTCSFGMPMRFMCTFKFSFPRCDMAN